MDRRQQPLPSPCCACETYPNALSRSITGGRAQADKAWFNPGQNQRGRPSMLEIQGTEALELVTQHRRWLANDRRGKRADLSLRTLRGLDLRGADLTRAKLTGAQFI